MDTKTLSAEEIAAKAAEKATKAESKRKEKIAKEYPHAMIETLRFDAAAGNGGKYVVNIHCVECGDETREVYTSDLFQINKCTACSDAAKKAKKLNSQFQ